MRVLYHSLSDLTLKYSACFVVKQRLPEQQGPADLYQYVTAGLAVRRRFDFCDSNG